MVHMNYPCSVHFNLGIRELKWVQWTSLTRSKLDLSVTLHFNTWIHSVCGTNVSNIPHICEIFSNKYANLSKYLTQFSVLPCISVKHMSSDFVLVSFDESVLNSNNSLQLHLVFFNHTGVLSTGKKDNIYQYA